MRIKAFSRSFIPPGPVLVLTLIGVMVLSVVLYNRAVRVQRFLEPALALSQPRTEFYNSISRLLIKEFGNEGISGIRFLGHSLIVSRERIFSSPYHDEQSDTLKKLSRVFLGIMQDENMRAYVDYIVVSPRVPLTADIDLNRRMRMDAELGAMAVLNAIFDIEPQLEKNYAIYFQSAAMPIYAKGNESDWVEFHIIPSERLHIDVLERLQKYIR